jgi:hypothetical protein
MRSVRSEAPYLPSNVEFVAANNGAVQGGGVGSGTCLGCLIAAALIGHGSCTVSPGSPAE